MSNKIRFLTQAGTPLTAIRMNNISIFLTEDELLMLTQMSGGLSISDYVENVVHEHIFSSFCTCMAFDGYKRDAAGRVVCSICGKLRKENGHG